MQTKAFHPAFTPDRSLGAFINLDFIGVTNGKKLPVRRDDHTTQFFNDKLDFAPFKFVKYH
jgi:hypothetical protein